jgi:hypothetical protein
MIKLQKLSKNINYISNKNIFDICLKTANSGNSSSSIIIPHVCNNVNAFGAGFALDIAQRYPLVKNNFHLLGKHARLGYVQFIEVFNDKKFDSQIIIANMIAQNGLINKNNPRPLNYGYLTHCMFKVASYIENINKNKESTDRSTQIHCPKFGSGLAGGNWSFIENLITDIWSSHPVFVYLNKI